MQVPGALHSVAEASQQWWRKRARTGDGRRDTKHVSLP